MSEGQEQKASRMAACVRDQCSRRAAGMCCIIATPSPSTSYVVGDGIVSGNFLPEGLQTWILSGVSLPSSIMWTSAPGPVGFGATVATAAVAVRQWQCGSGSGSGSGPNFGQGMDYDSGVVAPNRCMEFYSALL